MVETVTAIALVFFSGGILLLERRCLGQIAFVQPLALCAIAGMATGQPGTGVWMGVSLQLLSAGQGHYADWALAGFAGAATLWLSKTFLHQPLIPGEPGALAAIGSAVLFAIVARTLERRFARTDGAFLRSSPPWDKRDTAGELENLAHRRLLRGGLVGALESTIAVTVSLVAVWASSFVTPSSDWIPAAVRVAVPALGMAVALGSLAGYRFVAYAGAGLAVTVAMWVVL